MLRICFIIAADILLVLLSAPIVQGGAFRPVVLMHGINSAANSMDPVQGWIEASFPGIYVKNVEIGDGYWSSFFMNMNDQVASFCQQMAADPLLSRGFNLIAYSQGGLVARGYIQRCNSPPVYNFITWSAPHGGQFGVPFTDLPVLDALVAGYAFVPEVQESITFAQYWKDPYQLEKYLDDSIFLADLNNERPAKNATYKQNLMSLNAFVMLYSDVDTVIQPRQSGWFYTWLNDTDTEPYPLQQQPIYVYDYIGLRALDENGRLFLYETSCPHTEYPTDACKIYYDEFSVPYLNNTLP